MKQWLLTLELRVLRSIAARIAVRGITCLGFRLKWIWGRTRFGGLVRQRGTGCICAYDVELKYPNNMLLGDRVIIGSNVSIGAHSPITFGDNFRISRDVIIETAGLDFSNHQPAYPHVSKPIIIEEAVWIGARAIILGGVTLGKNSIIAAGAVVTHSVPPSSMVAGVPARIVHLPVEG